MFPHVQGEQAKLYRRKGNPICGEREGKSFPHALIGCLRLFVLGASLWLGEVLGRVSPPSGSDALDFPKLFFLDSIPLFISVLVKAFCRAVELFGLFTQISRFGVDEREFEC